MNVKRVVLYCVSLALFVLGAMFLVAYSAVLTFGLLFVYISIILYNKGRRMVDVDEAKKR